MEDYWRKKPVILVREKGSNAKAHQHTEKRRLYDNFHQQSVRMATFESYAFKEKEQKGEFGSYLEQLGIEYPTLRSSDNSGND